MLNRRVRNFALAAMTISSAFLLAILGATAASASTNPICSGGAPRDCVQIFGNGLQVVQVDGWVWNNTGMFIGSAHIEFYDAPAYQSPNARGSHFLLNCGVFSVNPNSNSILCYDNAVPQPTGPIDECTASWQDSGSSHFLLGFACGRVT
jgi:hypothetical protein